MPTRFCAITSCSAATSLLITPDRWLADFEEAGFKDAVKPLILKNNAMRLLNLDVQQPA